MSSWSRLLSSLAFLALTCPAPADELQDARRQFLNLYNALYMKAIDVLAPPADKAPWAVRLEWEQAPGCPDWGVTSVALRADAPDGYAFDVLVESSSGPAGLAIYLTEADGDRWVSTVDVAAGSGKGWQHVDRRGEALNLWQFGDGKREPGKITGISFESSGHGSQAVYWVANLQIHTASGLRDVLPLMQDTDSLPPTGVAPAVRLPALPRVYMGMAMSWFVSPAGQEFVAKARERVPNLGVAGMTSGWRAEDQALIVAARQAGIDVRTQNAGTEGMRGLITRAAAWGTAPSGQSRNTTPGFENGMHGVSYCHPATREAVRRLLAGQRGVGILDYEQVDYVWPWFGGPWGYGEWDKAAFRTDLEGRDEGLRLADGTRCGFWDYLRAYGTESLPPAALGLTAWEQFEPKAPAELPAEQTARRQFVFTALTHYEWLKFAQAMGAEARSWGGSFMASMNPEDVSNGGDYLFWNRLADTGTAYYECFGNPAQSEPWRQSLPYLRAAATQAGKRLGVIFEVGVGGHGKPYLDPQVTYCWTYDVVAAGQFDDMQNEWMGEGDWAQSQEGYHRDRFDAWLATARGFNRAKADGALQSRPRVLAVGLRCVVHAVGYQPAYLLTRTALDGLNVDCAVADLTLDPAQWEAYDVLIYTPWESAARHLQALPAWLDAKPGRLLITHGAVPTRLADGLGYLPRAALGDGTLGRGLGLGEISTGAALAADPLTTADGWTARALAVGRTVKLPGPLFQCSAGTPLATLGTQALVTTATRANGSRVVYLNYAAGQPETRDVDQQLLRAALASAGSPATTVTPGVYCHTYAVGAGTVAVLWSTAACERFKFEYRGDIEQRLAYRDPAVDIAVQVSVPAGSYRVLDWLEQQEQVSAAAEGTLTLKLQGRSCALYYFGPDTAAWQASLEGLRQAPLPGAL
jgi:hypothetical protein